MPAWSVAIWTRGKAGEVVTCKVRSVVGAGGPPRGGRNDTDKDTRTAGNQDAGRSGAGGVLPPPRALAATRVRTSASRAAEAWLPPLTASRWPSVLLTTTAGPLLTSMAAVPR